MDKHIKLPPPPGALCCYLDNESFRHKHFFEVCIEIKAKDYIFSLVLKFSTQSYVFFNLQYLNTLLDLFNDPVLDAGLTKDVVWGDAGLTTVTVLPPRDTPTEQRKCYR